MNDQQTNQWRFREFRETDMPAWVEIANLEYADEPTTVEQELHWERTYPNDNPRLRVAVETADGR